jgi:hypothetical protein
MLTINKLASGAAVLLVVGACAHGDPVSNAGGNFGTASLLNGSPSATTLPSGGAGIITSLDATLPDAFSRIATDGNRGAFYSGGFFVYRDVNMRNGTAGRNDPRFPVLVGSATADNASGPQIYPDDTDGPGWELYFPVLAGLTPNATHTIVFVNYYVKQAGQLDQEEKILTGAVTQRDTLKLNGGTRDSTDLGAAAANWTGAAASCGRAPNVATPNPWIVAREPADAGGSMAGIDKCWLSGTVWYTLNANTNYAKSMIGKQNNTTFALPNYNYIEVWEGDYGTGIPRIRMQVAQDVLQNGTPVNNGTPPFPVTINSTRLPIVDRQPFPLSDTLFSTLKGSSGLPKRGTITFNNLQQLSGAVYKVWYFNPTNGQATAAVGQYRRKVGATFQADSNLSTSSFAGGPGTISFVLSDYLTNIAPKVYTDSLRFLLVTKEADASAATPSAEQPLWVGVFKSGTTLPGGTMIFGSFNGGGATRMKFTPQGLASGGILGDTTVYFDTATVGGVVTQQRKLQFNGSQIEIRFSGLMRPPVGYEYKAYLRRTADTTVVEVGGLTGPQNESLDGADTAPQDANMSATAIVFSKLVFDAHSQQDLAGATDQLCNYDQFRLYLVPRGGVGTPNPTSLIFNIAMPARIAKASKCV